MKLTLLKATTICTLLCVCTIGFSQVTNIPDVNFEQSLIDQGIDSDGVINGQVLTADIASLTELNVSNSGITNLQGIEDFAALDYLNASFNDITTLDMSNNMMLDVLNVGFTEISSLNITNTPITYLEVNHTNLNTLDVSNTNLEHLNGSHSDLIVLNVNNTNLNYLDVSNTDITSLDVSNIDINILDVNDSAITSLNVSNNPNLISLNAQNTQLTALDLTNTNLQYINISNNTALTSMDLRNGNNTNVSYYKSTNTPNLTCINVDDKAYSDANWTNKDVANEFSEDCGDTLSITENNLEAAVTVYPNPFTNYITIDFNSGAQLKHTEIFNILGQRVVMSDQLTITTSQLQSGVYLIKITTDQGSLTKKLIKK